MAKGKSARAGGGWLLWIGIATLIVVVDQFTKVLILGSFQYGESLPITAYFNLVRVHNLGAAFSFLSNAGGWQRWFFTALGIVALFPNVLVCTNGFEARSVADELTVIRHGRVVSHFDAGNLPDNVGVDIVEPAVQGLVEARVVGGQGELESFERAADPVGSGSTEVAVAWRRPGCHR